MKIRALAAVGAAVLNGCVLAGCSRTASPVPESPAASYFADEKTKIRKETVFNDALEKCMKQKGFAYLRVEESGIKGQRTRPTDWVFTPAPEYLDQFGYGATEMEIGLTVHGNRYSKATLRTYATPQERDAYSAALSGPKGCFAANRKLAPSPDSEVIEVMFNRFFDKINANRAISVAVRQWSKCMAADFPTAKNPQEFRRGIEATSAESAANITDGKDLENVAELRVMLKDVQALEIFAAKRDSQCQQVHLEGVRSEYEKLESEVFDPSRRLFRDAKK